MKKRTGIKDNQFEKILFRVIALLVLIFFCGMGLYFFIYKSHPVLLSSSTPITTTPAKYISDETCIQCHQEQGEQWAHSHHALAMQSATGANVLADFNHTKFIRQGVLTLFYKRDNKFWVKTEGKEYEIKYTLGIDPLQTYLITLPGGRLQSFTLAWDTIHKRWFDLYPNEKTPPGDVLHFTGRYQNANMMCVTCHTTNFDKNYSSKDDTYHSTWSSMNVGCQACHGPGEHHVQWAQDKRLAFKNEPKGLINTLNTPKKMIETCASCHARRTELIAHPDLSKPLLDNYLIPTLTPDAYHADGQQLGEVYVYNSFRQSKMYQMGVTCIDCHNPHSGKLKAEGNAVCTQCHNPTGNSRFPSAAGSFDTPQHTFHQTGSTGAQCVNCHMPRKNYMMIQARPDHSIRIPRPDLTLKFGTPNACTNCHTDKSAKWANDALQQWYPQQKHTQNTSTIMQATGLEQLKHTGARDEFITAAKNKNATLRLAAVSGLINLPLNERVQQAGIYLADPIRAIRIEAARIMATVPQELLNAEQFALFKKAKAELINAETLSLDMPGANLNLAVFYENLGETTQAINLYLHALQIDPDFTPARLNLARLYSINDQNSAAEQLLHDGVQRIPNQGELHYALALVLGEEEKNAESLSEFALAANYLPTRARVLFNYGLMLQKEGKIAQSRQILTKALELDPNDPDIRSAITINSNI